MGIGWHEAKALIQVYRQNGPLGRTATLGRQGLYFRTPILKKLFAEAGAVPHGSLDEFLAHSSFFAEDFFRLLGSTEIMSFDYADYEGATVCHDMNLPLPETYRNAFDLVYDGGTLEHVFNFPQSIRNCMLMPREGGLFVASTPANNWMGHGFYQFSPELYFRVLSPENGFRIERMIAADYREGGPWFEVQDPEKLGKRVELWGAGQRVELLIVARKIGPVSDHWVTTPQQSDYVATWNQMGCGEPSLPPHGARARLALFLRPRLPRLWERIRRYRAAERSRREMRDRRLELNHEAFRKVDR